MFQFRRASETISLRPVWQAVTFAAITFFFLLYATSALAQITPALKGSVTVDFQVSAKELGGKTVRLIADPEINDFKVPVPAETLDRVMIDEASSSIQVIYLAAGETDPLGIGDSCIAWPQDAKTAFEYACSVWEAQLTSSVPITIKACWADNLDPGVLGHNASLGHTSLTDGTNTWWFPSSLANAITGTDNDPSEADMYIAYSSTFAWYYGTDTASPNDKFDLASVSLHEICHGLGFSSSFSVSGGLGSWGGGTSTPKIYDYFIVNGSGQGLIDPGNFPNDSTALAAQLQGGNLFFAGANAMAANGGFAPGIYAPGTWNGGSSLSHLDETFNNTSNALMTYSLGYGEAIHDTGPVTRGLLTDIGWIFSGSATTTTTTVGCGDITITHSASQTITASNAVACIADGTNFHMDNSYWRSFSLSSFGISDALDVCAVEIGIEVAAAGSGGVQPVTVRLYTASQAFPGGYPGSLTLIGEAANVSVADQNETVLAIPVTGTAPAGSELVVEIFTPNGQAAGHSFFIGSNASTETGPSYILSAGCSINTPTSFAGISYPNVHIVMNVLAIPPSTTSIPPTTTTTSIPPTTTTTSIPPTTTTTSIPPTTTTTTIDRICPAQKILGADDPGIAQLRDLRDSRLASSALGRRIINLYYNNAGTINAALERSPALRASARRVLKIIAWMTGE